MFTGPCKIIFGLLTKKLKPGLQEFYHLHTLTKVIILHEKVTKKIKLILYGNMKYLSLLCSRKNEMHCYISYSSPFFTKRGQVLSRGQAKPIISNYVLNRCHTIYFTLPFCTAKSNRLLSSSCQFSVHQRSMDDA